MKILKFQSGMILRRLSSSSLIPSGGNKVSLPGHGRIRKLKPPIPNAFDINMDVPSFLRGRDIISFDGLSTEDIYSLLWISLDLKGQESMPNLCNGKTISLISSNALRKISFTGVGTKLGAAVAIVSAEELCNEGGDFEILGKCVGSACDAVIFDSNKIGQKGLEEFAIGCTVPVICLESANLCPLYALSELMTLFEHYDYLRRLMVSYIGCSSQSLLNTYMTLFPKVGMHLRYLIDKDVNAEFWQKGIELSAQYNTELKQCEELPDVLYRSHTMSVTSFDHDADVTVSEITVKDMEEMDLNRTILAKDIHLHQGKNSPLPKELLRCKESLIWKNVLNVQWILMASVIATIGRSFTPTIPLPPFQGKP